MRVEFEADAVLFDMDGVLVDSIPAVERHWRVFADRRQLDPDEVVSGIHGRRSSEIIAEYVPTELVAEELAWMESLEVDDAADLSVLPGARDLLGSLVSSSWAVVTSGARSIADARLKAAGLTLPQVLITSDDVTHGKPDPACYLEAADRLGVVAQRCVVFEDAPAGIAAAVAARMTVIGLSTTHRESELTAAVIIPDLSHVRLLNGSPVRIELASISGGR
jgi:sugar-phosphatase